MASSESTNGVNGSSGKSASQILREKHAHDEAHQPTIEEVVDEADLKHTTEPISSSVLEEKTDAPGWVPPMSTKAAGKQKAEDAPKKDKIPVIDTHSEESFPGLGPTKAAPATSAPTWGAKKSTNGATNGSSTPNSGVATPLPSKGAPQSLAGQVQPPLLVLQKQDVLPRTQLKKPLPELVKDINKKYRTNISSTTREGGVLEFRESSNQKDAIKQQAIRDLGAQIGAKTSAKLSIPRSSRAHIIGKGGATIKALQEKTGAKIQMPKMEDTPYPVDEDDDMIDIVVEGNPIAISLAKKEINKIANERVAPITSKSRNIPAEFYPFLAGPASALEESHGVQVRVPPYYTWNAQPPPQKPQPGQAPEFLPAHGDNHITFQGDRAAVQAAKAQIEQRAMLLQRQLALEEFYLNREQHQFIVGERGVSPEEFYAHTGCAIIMPGSEDESTITVVGPADRLQHAMDHAMDLASQMNSSSIDISRQYKNAPVGARVHGRYITQYLRDRGEIDRLSKQHKAFIETPINADGAAPWQLFYRDADKQASIRAQNEINNILIAHPPSRVATVPVDPFYHAHVRTDITPRVKKDYGVHVVVPSGNESGPILLIFEGDAGAQPQYQIPRGQPSAEELKAFKQGLDDARAHILDILSKQADITSTSIDVPAIFHEKLKRFIKKEQADRSIDQIPVRVTNTGTIVTLRGPAPSVKALADKVNAFVAEAIEDEKERGFTLSFDFPQKHANQLVGKGGSNIRDLRDKYDVEINIKDGVVELKGPKAKAEAAKSAISALGRQWADEATYTLKVDPKFHRELIGQKGEQINKLQTRYKVQIHFPRSAKPAKDDQSNADAASEAGRRGPRREQEPDEVVVRGPTKGADGARDEILSLLQYYKDNSFSAIVSVQAGQIPSLIGSRGSGMDEIRQATGARINIPNAREIADPSTRVEIEIKGTKAQVTQAKKLIEEKKDVFDSTVIRHLDVDKKYHRSLIGAGGSTLRDIVVKAGGSEDRRELARTIQFPKEGADNNSIKIEGKSDIVDKIIKAMEQIVLERENQTSETVDIPTDQHRSLIGRGGETKKELESKFKVSIDIPRQGSGLTGIKIVGQAADVEKAKAHISGLVKEQEGETIQVPKKLHHSIADNGQFFRSLRNNHQVTVDHGGHKLPPKPTAATPKSNDAALPLITDDQEESHVFNVVNISNDGPEGEIPWILRGSPENLPKARSALEAAIEQALKNTTTGYLILPDPRTYRYVIGQGGSKVNSIREATGCKITVPRDQAKNEAIEIVGNEKGVEKAKDLILKAVKEGTASNANSGSRGSNGNGPTSNQNGNWD